MRLIDEIGNRYGKLVVVKQVEHPRGRHARWLCHCDCGTERVINGGSLRRGDSQSCGCLQREREHAKEMEGQKFGRLVVIRRDGSNKWGLATWLCECQCGKKTVVTGRGLRSGNTKSCGCLRKERVGEINRLIPKRILPVGEAAFNALIGRMKYTAKKRGYLWDLTDDQVKQLTSQPCYYCGIEPFQQEAIRRRNGTYVYNGLDRVENHKGYTPENVIPCCGICNAAKSDRNLEQFEMWIRNIYKHFVET